MKLVFTESAWKDYLWFQENNRKLLKRINGLIKDAQRTSFEGIGKPERLKADFRDIGQDVSIWSIDLYTALPTPRLSSFLAGIITKNEA